MNCPPGISVVILDILYKGVVRTRFAGRAGDADWAAREADHIHNLPWLVRNFSLAALQKYLESQVPYYTDQSSRSGVAPTEFERHWEILRQYLNAEYTPNDGD